MSLLPARITGPLNFVWSRIRSGLHFLRVHLKATIATILLLLIALVSYAVTRPVQPSFITAVAERGGLKQTVEAVGTVISERDLELQFPTIDVVSQVLVKEGDQVRAGARLASLRSGTLSAGVASASASVQSAQAALRALEEGSRPEDIIIAEAGVQNKRAALDVAKQTFENASLNLVIAEQKLVQLKKETEVNLSGQVQTAASALSQQLSTAKTALQVIDGVFDANDVADAVVKARPVGYDTMVQNVITTSSAIDSELSKPPPLNYQNALDRLRTSRAVSALVADIGNRAYDIIATLPTTNSFTNTSKETNKTTIAGQRSNVQSALSNLDSVIRSLQDASVAYDTRIANQQSEIVTLAGTRDRAKTDISTFETSLKIEEAQLALKKAPARQTDIDSARARVRQAQADLARAGAQFRDTILTAPVDGVITKVDVKVGEIRPSSVPSITLLGNTPYRVEIFVSEVDIPKIVLGQTGAITLDAYRDTEFPLRVTEIGPSATDKDGVPKYLVKMDFLEKPEGLKIGMTGDAEIITGSKEDVVSVPVRAVIENEDGKEIVRILKEDGTVEEREVTSGMEGEGGQIEVTNIKEGETVVVLIK